VISATTQKQAKGDLLEILEKSNAICKRVGYVWQLLIHHFKGSFTFLTALHKYVSSSLVGDDEVPTDMSVKSMKLLACFWILVNKCNRNN